MSRPDTTWPHCPHSSLLLVGDLALDRAKPEHCHVPFLRFVFINKEQQYHNVVPKCSHECQLLLLEVAGR